MNRSSKFKKREEIIEIEMATGMRTAILVDGAFFLKRFRAIYPRPHDAKTTAEKFYTMVHSHVQGKSLYRIFYYDCIPFEKKVLTPISKNNKDYSLTPVSQFRLDFFEELKKKRKVALRLGELHDGNKWTIKPEIMKKLLNRKMKYADLKDDDFYYDLKQKGVDIKIGVDIAALAYKKLVQQIILISGDSDFVPAAKVARREGIDFVLDPMYNHVKPSLFEHIDGLKSVCPQPKDWKKKQ